MATSEQMVDILTQRQHLHPHDPLGHAIRSLELPDDATSRALSLLDLDRTQSIERLRRTELIQLGRTIHRLLRQPVAGEVVESQPLRQIR